MRAFIALPIALLGLAAACGEVRVDFVDAAGDTIDAETTGPDAGSMVTLTVLKAGSGTVTSDPAGIACGAACSIQLPRGAQVTLTATPDGANGAFSGWSGGGCSGTRSACSVRVDADTVVNAAFGMTFAVTATMTGAPAGTSLTATSPTAGAVCAGGSCTVPSGGAVTFVAPTVTDHFFEGWSGAASATTTSVTLTNITSNATLNASYITTRSVPCRDLPPANATTTSTGNVTITYTTAGGWTQPALCPFACNTDYCLVGGASCQLEYIDQVSFQSGSATKWFGGDDRPGFSRSIGTGQGVTPTSNVTMHRFGFRVAGGFTFASSNQYGTANNVLRLDRRDANGSILATYTTSLAPNFAGGWIYWNTPATTLPANQLQVFTAYLTNAFSQRVNSGSAGDANAGYAGGGGYSGEVASGDLNGWNAWGPHSWDFQFRVQSRNAQCQ